VEFLGFEQTFREGWNRYELVVVQNIRCNP